MTRKQHNSPGYIALSTMLVILVITLMIGTSVALSSISDSQLALSDILAQKTDSMVDSCTETALLKLNDDNSIPTTITLPDGDCTITIDNQTGNQWTFTIAVNYRAYTRQVQVTATRTNTVTLDSWQEQ